MTRVYISGLSDFNANGVYYMTNYNNGIPFFQHSNNNEYIICYFSEYLPYAKDPAYYIIKQSVIYGSVPVNIVKYVNFGQSVVSGTWISVQDITSGENNITSLMIDYMSSSSNSSFSSNSSNSSSSNSSSSSQSASDSSSSS